MLVDRVMWMLLWALLCCMGIAYLPGFSEYDTGKYLSIAQQMMDHHHYLYAYWEGQLYSDKPPLLFWLIIGGWKVFGINTWWPQCLVLAIATGSLAFTLAIARRLWPNNTTFPWLLPLLVIGCFHWYWFAREIRVDSLLTFAVLWSLWSLLNTLDQRRGAWLSHCLAIGLGGFAKGPVILVFILVPALLLPWCVTPRPLALRRWYTQLTLSTLLGLCIPLSWAIPAALAGGKQFSHQIFFDQIAHRANQHRESRWFYLLRLPLYTLPWSLYPPLWQGLARLRTRLLSPLGWCLSLLITSWLVFSLFGQKIPHYLFPSMPMLLLVCACALSLSGRVSRFALWPMAAFMLGFGGFCVAFTSLASMLPPELYARGYFLNTLPLIPWGAALMALGVVMLVMRTRELKPQILLMTAASLLLNGFINMQVLNHYGCHIDHGPLVTLLQGVDADNLALAPGSEIKSRELIDLLAALQRQPRVVADLAKWQLQHPQGLIFTSNLQDFKRHRIQHWWFQERYTLLGVVPSTDY